MKIKKLTFFTLGSLMFAGGLLTTQAHAEETKENGVHQEIVMDNEWNEAKKAGFSKEQYQHIMAIPKSHNESIVAGTKESLNAQQQAIINEAKKYIGVPYVWGSSTPDGFDCSGLVQYVYKHAVNMDLGRTTYDQEKQGTAISVSEAKPGDLLFWNNNGDTYHVAIYIGNNQFIHAPKPGETVQISSFYSGWMPSFARRVISMKPSTVGYDCDKYAVISKENYKIWNNLSFETAVGTTTGQLNKMYHIKRYYKHSNGHTYVSLYDKDDKWIGYLNEDAITYKDQFGAATTYNKYGTVFKKGYKIWQDKNFKNAVGVTDDIYHQTVLIKVYYDLFDGRRYYSIYNNKDKWLGYVGANCIGLGLEDGNSLAGAAIKNESYMIIQKSGYNLWKDFSFNVVKSTTDDKVGKVYRSTCYYQHFKGSQYLSVYDKDNKWLGYLNKDAATYTDSMFGNPVSFKKYVQIVKPGYGIFKDKQFKKKVNTSDNLLNKVYFAKGYYDLFDGTRYYSLYENDDTWVGYIRSTATKIID